MKSMIKNKRGDIPITVFVVSVLAVCGLILFSFYISNKGVVDDLEEVEIVEAAAKENGKVSFYEEIGFDESEIENLVNIQQDSRGRRHIYLEGERISVRYYLSGSD